MIAAVQARSTTSQSPEYKHGRERRGDPDPADVRLASSYIEAGKPDRCAARKLPMVIVRSEGVNPAVKKFAQAEQARAEKIKAAKK